jgi:hypothetical protein
MDDDPPAFTEDAPPNYADVPNPRTIVDVTLIHTERFPVPSRELVRQLYTVVRPPGHFLVFCFLTRWPAVNSPT